MRVGKSKRGRGILAVAVTAIGILFLCAVERQESKITSESALGSPRLVSIEELPDLGDICVSQPTTRSSSMIAALQDNNLFSAFQEKRAYASSQEGGQTGDGIHLLVRPIRDTMSSF